MSSDIRVFAFFKDQSVFAGEDIQCIITFKNMASISDNLASETKTRHPLRWAASESVADNPHIRRKGGLGLGNPLLTPVNSRGARETSKTGHRATTSLSSPFPGSSVSSPWTASPATRQRQPHTHQRSVSIMSMGSPDVRNEGTQRAIYPSISRPTINHGRSTSHQGHLKKSDGNHDGPSPCEYHVLNFRIPPYHIYSVGSR